MAEWETLDKYERAGTVLNYVAALAALAMAILLWKEENCKKIKYAFLFIFVLVSIGNTAFVVKTG